jgi:hypothetical protein
MHRLRFTATPYRFVAPRSSGYLDYLLLILLVLDFSIVRCLSRRKPPGRNASLIQLIEFSICATLGLREQQDARDQVQCSSATEEKTSLLSPTCVLVRKHQRYGVTLGI